MRKLMDTLQGVLDEVRPGLRLMQAPDDAIASKFRRDDLIIVDAQDTETAKGIYVLDRGAGHIVRRVSLANGGMVRVTTDDPGVTPVYLTGIDLRQSNLGRVVGAVVKVPEEA